MKALSSPQHFLHYKSLGNFFDAQGWVTPKWILRSDWKSNSPEILCLFLLPTSFMKIRPKLKALSQHFFFRCSRASNTKVTSYIWPEFQFIRDFMPVWLPAVLQLSRSPLCRFANFPFRPESPWVVSTTSPFAPLEKLFQLVFAIRVV